MRRECSQAHEHDSLIYRGDLKVIVQQECCYVTAGEAEFTLRELVTARGNRLQLPLQDGALDASCTLIAQDCSALNSEVR